MKRLLMVCALAGLAVACGDDDGDDPRPTPDSGVDSGIKSDGGSGGTDSGIDSGPGVSVKVTNVGTACTVANQSTTCTGGATAICRTEDLRSIPIPGGSCSAVCSDTAECGPGGNCAIGAMIKMYPAQTLATLGSIGYCHKACPAIGAAGCATGQSCVSLNELNRLMGIAATPLPQLNETFCFPTPAAGDAGVSDGGTALRLDGGLDGG